jgi:hypothetical protein
MTTTPSLNALGSLLQQELDKKALIEHRVNIVIAFLKLVCFIALGVLAYHYLPWRIIYLHDDALAIQAKLDQIIELLSKK